jgi:ornithine cyclodeaminase/alanine dehydrogenase-like protein (mu-crystallin family)
VYDLLPEKAEETCNKLRQARPGVNFTPLVSIHELVERSGAVITATTSEDPVVPDHAELLRGKTFIGIGSYKPNVRELPDTLFSLVDRVFIDSLQAPLEAGDLFIPLKKGILRKESMHTIGKLINGTMDTGQEQTRLFKSVGMAIFDIVLARTVYDIASRNNVGIEVEI